MAQHRISHQNFSDSRCIGGRPFQVFLSVLNKILHVANTILKSLWLRFKPLVEGRLPSSVTTKGDITIVRSRCETQYRDRVAIVEPKPNGSFELRSGGGFLCYNKRLGVRQVALGFWGAHWLYRQCVRKLFFEADVPHDDFIHLPEETVRLNKAANRSHEMFVQGDYVHG